MPALTVSWGAVHGELGANPIEFVTHSTGDWTLRFLLITLAVTPARQLTAVHLLIRFRRSARMLGLFVFFYGCLHLLTYIWLHKCFNVGEIWGDIGKQPFITVGVATFLLMVPLAVTSTAAWIRRLGGERWQLLHRLAYLIAVGGVIHYYWLVKSDIREPALRGLTLTLLLAYWLVALFGNRRVKHENITPQIAIETIDYRLVAASQRDRSELAQPC